MRYLICLVVLFAVVAGAWAQAAKPPVQPVQRYQIVAPRQGDGKGSHAVFRLDTFTGAVSYCVPVSNIKDVTLVVGVQCFQEGS